MVLTRIEEYGSRPTEECHWAACCIYLVHTCILQQQQYCLLLCLPGWKIYTVRIWSRDRWWCCLSEVWLHRQYNRQCNNSCCSSKYEVSHKKTAKEASSTFFVWLSSKIQREWMWSVFRNNADSWLNSYYTTKKRNGWCADEGWRMWSMESGESSCCMCGKERCWME